MNRFETVFLLFLVLSAKITIFLSLNQHPNMDSERYQSYYADKRAASSSTDAIRESNESGASPSRKRPGASSATSEDIREFTSCRKVFLCLALNPCDHMPLLLERRCACMRRVCAVGLCHGGMKLPPHRPSRCPRQGHTRGRAREIEFAKGREE